MNSKQLQYFLVTVKKGSIASAARELEIAQPAISQQLANLEHELKTTLFERDFRGVRLTNSGRLFYQHAQLIVQQMSLAKNEIKDIDKKPCGSVSIGMTQAICNVLSAALIAEIEMRFPGIELQLITTHSSNLPKWLKMGEVDLVLTYEEHTTSEHIQTIPLFKENLYLVASTSSLGQDKKYQALLQRQTISFTELAEYQVVVPNQKDALTDLLHKYEAKTGILLQYRATHGQLMTTLRYITERNELFILPSSAVFHLEESGQVKSLLITDPQVTRDVVVMTSKERPVTKAMQVVQSVIADVTKKANIKNQWRGDLLQYKPEIYDIQQSDNSVNPAINRAFI